MAHKTQTSVPTVAGDTVDDLTADGSVVRIRPVGTDDRSATDLRLQAIPPSCANRPEKDVRR